MLMRRRILHSLYLAMAVAATSTIAGAQQRGGVLQIAHRDSPAMTNRKRADDRASAGVPV